MKKIPLYGRDPVHLVGVLFCYALVTYAGVKLFSNVALWVALAFPGGVFLHDFVLFPLYAKADTALTSFQSRQKKEGKLSKPWINYVRVPVVISFLLLLCYFPIILRLASERPLYTGLPQDSFLYRWLIVTAALAAGSAFSYFLPKERKRRNATGSGPKK